MPSYCFDIFLDSKDAKLYWDGKVLELEYEREENESPPSVDEIVVEAIDYVADLPDTVDEYILLKRTFAKALKNADKFTVTLNLKKSCSASKKSSKPQTEKEKPSE